MSKKKIPKIAALYCRLSLEDGKENESLSISNQKAMLQDYAQKNGIYNYEFYV
ncbi:MAG: recombinase, partial [Eubacteriales bacterium]